LGEYDGIKPVLRRDTLQYLTGLLTNHREHIYLCVAEGKEVGFSRRYIPDFDSRLFVGDTLALYRDHRGNQYWCADPKSVSTQKQLFIGFRDLAKFKGPAVIDLLNHLIADI
jgi:hypothetical protein